MGRSPVCESDNYAGYPREVTKVGGVLVGLSLFGLSAIPCPRMPGISTPGTKTCPQGPRTGGACRQGLKTIHFFGAGGGTSKLVP
jgi:hypothetical protein